MKLNLTLVIAGALACAGTLAAVTETAVAAESKITILYDAFGDDAAMKKDWGFSALVEVAGKRILFDTGNDRDIFAANVKAKNIDLTNSRFRRPVAPPLRPYGGPEPRLEREPEGEDLRSQGRLRHLRLVAAIELLP